MRIMRSRQPAAKRTDGIAVHIVDGDDEDIRSLGRSCGRHEEQEHKKHEAEILAQISDLVRSAKALDKKLKARASR